MCALEFAYEMGMMNIILEGDALIKKLQSREPDLSPIGTLISKAKLSISQFISCKFNHVIKINNEVAHLSTKYRSWISNECLWVDEVPNFIHNGVMYDLLNY